MTGGRKSGTGDDNNNMNKVWCSASNVEVVEQVDDISELEQTTPKRKRKVEKQLNLDVSYLI